MDQKHDSLTAVEFNSDLKDEHEYIFTQCGFYTENEEIMLKHLLN
jgi:hypothetical protein